ncbi:hypothetical protein GCM10009754_41500 [Amycolatopsis minnesotensis]|uniref:Uncharacterized protein n=1 Tax=Amycolatopsis minnesotensis TaxID=337894 RepID=A0ABN2R860_9PSEU
MFLDTEYHGSLNLYSDRPNAYDRLDAALLELFTTAAEAAIRRARRYAAARLSQSVTLFCDVPIRSAGTPCLTHHKEPRLRTPCSNSWTPWPRSLDGFTVRYRTIHRALMAGAEPAEVARAAGCTVAEAHLRWHTWADAQLHATPAPTTTTGTFALAHYLRVHELFATAIT